MLSYFDWVLIFVIIQQCQAFIRVSQHDCNQYKIRKLHHSSTAFFISSSSSSALSSPLYGQRNNDDNHDKQDNNEGTTAMTTTTPSRKSDAITLQRQAEALRSEALMMEKMLNDTKAEKIRKETEKIEHWIEQLLLVDTAAGAGSSSSSEVQILNTKERAAQIMQEERFSAEQINKIFYYICNTSSKQSIDNHSPLIELLLEAACKVDCLEREKNPNKRWNHRVERDLRKKLFAMGWNIHLEDDDDYGFERFN
mmetsp:Transcript_25011/g.38558  ORF Transcript_25011/g.38558 Transcript_25011/m.38558 type:complete len:253 (+) Transcript_25011:143-901(+)